jgi:cytidylate kinase
MYRAVTLFGLKQQPEGRLDLGVLTQSLDQIKIHFEGGAEAQQTFLNGENVTSALRDPKINEYVSEVAALEAVRSFLGEQQKRMGTDKGIVMDGRDIGTVIFPQADCKFF